MIDNALVYSWFRNHRGKLYKNLTQFPNSGIKGGFGPPWPGGAGSEGTFAVYPAAGGLPRRSRLEEIIAITRALGESMADDVFVSELSPYLVEVEAGKAYLWCACGRSKRQPFCDGSHLGTEHRPKPFKAERSESLLLCGCKQTNDPPFCDGSHNNL
jgi:CDGSH-type Zn-finger protein